MVRVANMNSSCTKSNLMSTTNVIRYDESCYPHKITHNNIVSEHLTPVIGDSVTLLTDIVKHLPPHHATLPQFVATAIDLFKCKAITLTIDDEDLTMTEANTDDQQFIIDELTDPELTHIDPLFPNTYYMRAGDMKLFIQFLTDENHKYTLRKHRDLSSEIKFIRY